MVSQTPTKSPFSSGADSQHIVRNTANEEDIGFQVDLGCLRQSELKEEVLVISQGWPSWSFALDGLGFADIKTLANFQSLSSREEFKATSLGNTLIRKDQLPLWLSSGDSKNAGLVFVQGDQKFLETTFLSLADVASNRVVYSCTEEEFETADCWRESHAAAGGVTTGSWSFYSHNLSIWSKGSNTVRRTLRHVLRTTEGSSSKYQLHKSTTDILKPNQRAVWNDKFPSVNTFSVFDKEAPVNRLITIEELLDVYDFELSVQSELKKYWASSKTKPTRSFVNQIPIKVLRSVALRVIDTLSSTKDEDIFLSAYDSDSTILHTNAANDYEESDMESIAVEITDDSSTFKSSSKSTKSDKAACNDEDEADEEDWDIWSVANFAVKQGAKPLVCTGIYMPKIHQPFFSSLRKLLIRRYRRNVCQSFLRYLRNEYYVKQSIKFELPTHDIRGKLSTRKIKVAKWTSERNRRSNKRNKKICTELEKDLEIGRDAVARAANSSWWNWDNGSTLFFWRWPKWSKKSVRDGIKLFVDWSNMPSYWKKQQWPDDPASVKKLKKKLSNVRDKKYVQPGFVKSLTSYFAVPKAKTDIRVVYDATACGLNDSLWAPNFFLPTVDSILRNASADTWFGDIDLGEMFLNYPLDEDVRPYAGVDVTNADDNESEDGVKRIIERWARCLMGFKPSPFVTTQTFGWSEEIIIGDRLDITNPFYWDKVILNLPGTDDYEPSMPWVHKWNSRSKSMAAFFGTYIDDIRGGAASELVCRQAIHRAASRINYLGQQDAPRKRGQATKTPRAWAGSKCLSVEGEGLYVLSMKEKWLKAKIMIDNWYAKVVDDDSCTELEYKELERSVGFLCHVSRTYPIMFPYLKGFYNTLNNWRRDRDGDGWKLSRTAWMELISGDIAFEDEDDTKLPFESRKRVMKNHERNTAPLFVPYVERLKKDLHALKVLFSPDEPTLRLVRGYSLGCAIFAFGDASGGGFGSSWESAKGISYRYGTWAKSMDGESSNLRELMNLVETIEEMVEQNTLKGKELFLFTDNSTSEAAFSNGSSKSEKLFDLVLRIKQLEMHNQAKIHIIHVSGERMKDQGSDGLSRGNLNVGVMAGKSMLSFVPIHLTAFERSPKLKDWLLSFVGNKTEFLTPEQWFTRGHDLCEEKWEVNSDGLKLPTFKSGSYIWSPAPCAGEAAIEELRRSRHKRQRSRHMFIIPRLMQPLWRKHLHKAADLILSLKPGHEAWPIHMYEPLTIAFIFPFIRQKPWQLRGSTQLMALGRSVSGMWAEDARREGPLLRELWSYQERLEEMPPKLASRMLQSEQIDYVPHCNPRKRRGLKMEEEERGSSLHKRKKG